MVKRVYLYITWLILTKFYDLNLECYSYGCQNETKISFVGEN